MRLRLLFKHSFGCDRDRDFTWCLVSRLCRLMWGRSLTFREDALAELGAMPQIRGAAPVEEGNVSVGHSRHRTSGGRAAHVPRIRS